MDVDLSTSDADRMPGTWRAVSLNLPPSGGMARGGIYMPRVHVVTYQHRITPNADLVCTRCGLGPEDHP